MAIQSKERDLIIGQKAALTDEELLQFGKIWFNKLNKHAKVEELLKMVSDTQLEMIFPEQTIRNSEDFRSWYDAVGENYYDQDHTIEKFAIEISDGAKIDVVVVWRAKQKADGVSLAVRVRQTWIITQSITSRQPVISNYVVHSFEDV